MNTRFFNGLVCTMQNGAETMPGEVWVSGNRILHAGPAKPANISFDEEIDVCGGIVMPGFKNAHSHSAMTFLRSYADDLPLLDWLEHQVFPMEAKLRDGCVYWLSRLAILEYLQSGITANFDMYMFANESAKAAIDSGFRTVFCGTLHNFYGSLKQLEEEYDKFSAMHELISAQLAFHAEYTCSPELLKGISEVVNRRQRPVYMHNSESKRETDECVKRTGLTPTAYMDSFGLYNFGGGAFHCVHVTEDDMQILNNRGMAVVTCPGSNTKLASGIAPVCRMLELGIPVALGTDGAASNNCLDMFREMFLVSGLQKLAQNDASALPAADVLKMATKTGAEVMGLNNCNCLAEGKLADIVVIDTNQPNMQPQNSPMNNLVYSGSKQNVRITMVNGRILYKDGEFFVNEEPSVIYKKANEIICTMR